MIRSRTASSRPLEGGVERGDDVVDLPETTAVDDGGDRRERLLGRRVRGGVVERESSHRRAAVRSAVPRPADSVRDDWSRAGSSDRCAPGRCPEPPRPSRPRPPRSRASRPTVMLPMLPTTTSSIITGEFDTRVLTSAIRTWKSWESEPRPSAPGNGNELTPCQLQPATVTTTHIDDHQQVRAPASAASGCHDGLLSIGRSRASSGLVAAAGFAGGVVFAGTRCGFAVDDVVRVGGRTEDGVERERQVVERQERQDRAQVLAAFLGALLGGQVLVPPRHRSR